MQIFIDVDPDLGFILEINSQLYVLVFENYCYSKPVDVSVNIFRVA